MIIPSTWESKNCSKPTRALLQRLFMCFKCRGTRLWQLGNQGAAIDWMIFWGVQSRWKHSILLDNPWIIYGSGWWYTYPSEKYEFVNWDDEILNGWKIIKVMFQPPPTSCWWQFLTYRYLHFIATRMRCDLAVWHITQFQPCIQTA